MGTLLLSLRSTLLYGRNSKCSQTNCFFSFHPRLTNVLHIWSRKKQRRTSRHCYLNVKSHARKLLLYHCILFSHCSEFEIRYRVGNKWKLLLIPLDMSRIAFDITGVLSHIKNVLQWIVWSLKNFPQHRHRSIGPAARFVDNSYQCAFNSLCKYLLFADIIALRASTFRLHHVNKYEYSRSLHAISFAIEQEHLVKRKFIRLDNITVYELAE